MKPPLFRLRLRYDSDRLHLRFVFDHLRTSEPRAILPNSRCREYAASVENIYRGWRRPGPLPPGGVDVEEGESLDVISGSYRIFQYERGHRYSTDDVLT